MRCVAPDAAAGDGGAVRLGVSMMCPGRQTLSMWTDVHPALWACRSCAAAVPVFLHYPLGAHPPSPTIPVNAMAQLLNS